MPERNCKTTKFQKSLDGEREREREREREILHAIDSAENFEEFDKSPHTHFCSIWITVAQQSMHKRCQIARLV
jgi:hypothetical protein